ncbi:MAG: DUF2256 domain-containing protein [Burkholderiaceae bacterium]|jgi:hypothetical protein
MSRGDHKRSDQATGFRGNKAHLPSKPCATCGRAMTWRKAWARNWDEVKHCSDACRATARRAR